MATKQPDTSEYGGQTVVGAGWPNADEEAVGAAADAFGTLATNLRDQIVPQAGRQRMKLSDHWEGTGAQAAYDEASGIITDHEHSQASAERVKGKLKLIEKMIADTKDLVNSTAQRVQKMCEDIHNEGFPQIPFKDTRSDRIEDEILKGYNENVGHVSDAAKSLAHHLHVPAHTPGADGKMPDPAQKGPSGSPGGKGEGSAAPGGLSEELPPAAPAPVNPAGPGGKGEGPAAPGGLSEKTPPAAPVPINPDPKPAAPPAPTPVPATGTPSGAPPSTGGGSQGPNVSPMSAVGSKSDAASAAGATGAPTGAAGTGAQPTNPLDQFQKGMADAAKASGPPQQMSSSPSQPLGGPPTSQPLNATPAGPPSGAPAPGTMAQAAGGVTGAGAAPVSAGPATGAAPSTPMPLGPPPTAPPAAPVSPGAPAPGALGPAVNSASTPTAGGGAQVAPIPVSAARAERDAAAKASRRSSSDPLELARRIAAALNVGTTAPRFMWLTALTNDGTIVVANNYGLGFVPDGVNLPDQVKFASLDESVAATERGRSATYPMLALESWAQAHDTQLRAVIALEDQLKGFDSGAATVVLHPDDLPANGQMQGRSRLMLIAPEVAERLSKVSDAGLTELLPPAPVDPQPPEDRRVKLLMAVFRPLLNSDPGRVAVQLQAMVAYGQHMYEVAMHAAYTATDGPSQREAIADALYWQHVSVLNSDALGDPS